MDSLKTEVVVLGAGPGGYAAAFAAADHGKKVILVEQEKNLGGVCLNRGCIPSKALLHATGLINATRDAAHHGLTFGEPKIDLDRLRTWKNSVITKLAGGIAALAKGRQVTVLGGRGYFQDANTLRVETSAGQKFIKFDHCIIAVGSKPAVPRDWDLGNPRVMTSTEALEIEDIPARLLVVGGGYIGMELGTVYAALGSEVTVVEALDTILAGADPDLAAPVRKLAEKRFKEIRVKAKVGKMATVGKQIKVEIEWNGQKTSELFDRVLVSVGRRANADDLGLENTGVERDERGFIKINEQQATSVPGLWAIGDIAGGVMLAHKASKEARICVSALTGEPATNEGVVIPAVVFTDPEVAWCGLTETEAQKQGREVKVAKFPWAASGRALALDRTDGLTKLIIDPTNERVLGVGIVGHGAGELIAEGVLAVECGLTAADLAMCVHPHPTLSETVMEAAEVFYGHCTHANPPKRRTE